MGRIISFLVLGMSLTACGYKQESFADDFATATCVLYEQCAILETYGGYDSIESCRTDFSSQVSPEAGRCPEYDKKLAPDCIDAINATTCAQFVEGFWPAECAKVCPDGSAEPPAPGDGGTDTGA